MAIPIANLSVIVTGALEAAKAMATETLPAAMTRDAIVEASRATVAWLTSHLWAWLAVARAIAVDNLPLPAADAVTGALEAAKAVATETLPAAMTRDAIVEASRATVAWLTSHLWAWLAVARAVAVDNLPLPAADAVTGALEAAKAVATETLPAAMTRDAIVEASRATVAWLTNHLWAWLAVARAVAVDNLPLPAADAWSGPYVQTAAKLFSGVYGWLAAAVVQKLPDVAAEKLLGVAAYATLALALLAVAFLGGAVWALTCRSMKGPGLGGARVPRAVFEANPKRYYATVRTARKAGRRAGGAAADCKLLLAGLLVAFAAYLAAKMLY